MVDDWARLGLPIHDHRRNFAVDVAQSAASRTGPLDSGPCLSHAGGTLLSNEGRLTDSPLKFWDKVLKAELGGFHPEVFLADRHDV